MDRRMTSTTSHPVRDNRVEDEVIGKWFPRIGALAVVLGAGFGFKYAIDQGWVGPQLRVIVGLLLSSVLISIGDWTRKREWTAYAGAITGGGIALMYLTLWATVGIYQLVAPSVGFLCLLGVSGLGCALALRHDSQALALLALVGGFVNPFVTGASAEMPYGLYLYTLCIDLAVVVLVFVRPWAILEKVAFTASWIVFEVGDAGPEGSLAAATGVFLMFGALPYVRLVLGKDNGVSDMAFVPVNGLIYYFAVFVRLQGDLEPLRGWFTLAMALAFLAGLWVVRTRGRDNPAIGTSSAAMSLLFLTLWSPVELGTDLMAFGWAVEALLLFGVAVVVKQDLVRWAAWGTLVLAAGVQLALTFVDPVGAINDHSGRFVFIALIAALYLAIVVEREALWDDLTDAAIGAASLLTILWLSLEVYSFVSHQGRVIPRAADLQFGLSGVWSIYASLMLGVGIAARSQTARLVALVLFGVTLVKMSLHDLWLLDTLQRLIGFVGIGVLLLSCSLVYHRFKSVLFPFTTQEVNR